MHRTVRIPLKMIDVDKGAVKVVKWVNSFFQTFTLWSCEGYGTNGKGDTYLPYVCFVCLHDSKHQDPIGMIREQVNGSVGVSLYSETQHVFGKPTTHRLSFDSRKAMRDFSRGLPKLDARYVRGLVE